MAGLALLCAAGALARSCPIDPNLCLYNVDRTFAEAYRIRYGVSARDGDYETILGTPKYQEALCDPENWKKRSEMCGRCPNELVFTSGLPEEFLNRPICLSEVEVLPHTDESHLTPSHPANNREMNVSYQSSCYTNPTPQDGPDTIVVGRGCGGAISKEVSNPAVTIAVRSLGEVEEDHENYPPFFSITADHKMPAFSAFSPYAFDFYDALRSATREGITVRAKVISNCVTEEEAKQPVDTSLYEGDTCPGWKMSHKDLCSSLPDESKRLCATCPLELVDPETMQVVSCLYSPDITPTRPHMLLNRNVSGTQERVNVTYFKTSWMANYCYTSTYENLQDKGIVAFGPGHEHGCSRTHALLAAQGAGVRGVINTVPDRIRGSSYGIQVPSASTASAVDMTAVAEFLELGTEVSSSVWRREVILRIPEHRPLDKTSAPPVQVVGNTDPVEDKASALEQPGVIVCAALLPLLLIGLAVFAWYTRKTTVPLPAGSGGVSLGKASTLLSMAMAVLLTAVTFSLSLTAGQRGVSKASDSGNRIAKLATDMNTLNVKTLTDGTVVQMLATARAAFHSKLSSNRNTGMESRIFDQKDNGEWGWSTASLGMGNLFQVIEDPTVKGSIPKQWAIYMREGGYWDSNGHRHGEYDFNWGASAELYDVFKWMSNSEIPTNYTYTGQWLTNTYQADLDVDGRFEFSEYQMPNPEWKGNYGPYVSYVKAFNTGGLPLGHYVVSEPLFHYSHVVQEALESHVARNPIAENMTFCFFREDGAIFAMTPGVDDLYQSIDFYGLRLEDDSGGRAITAEELNGEDHIVGHQLTTVFNTRQVHFNAMAYRFLDQFGTVVAKKTVEDGTTAVTQTFDQRDYARMTSSVIMHLRFDMTGLADMSGNNWDVRMVCATNSTCYTNVMNGRVGNSMHFDGDAVLDILPYLTQRTPRVAATRIPAVQWESSKRRYNETQEFDGIPDVVVTYAGIGSKDPVPKRPVMRERFHLLQAHSITMWVKPTSPLPNNASLFTDGGAYQLTGDAELIIAESTFGCRTTPLEGGLPVGQWTHVTTAVKYSGTDSYCAVYLNGTLHSTGGVSRLLDMPYQMGAYHIGIGFVGELDDLRFHNRTLSVSDAESMRDSGEEAPVESKYYSAVAIGIDLHKSAGFPSMVYSLAVPNEDIVREAQAAADRLMRNLQVEQDNTNRQLDNNTIETLLIILVVLLLSALIFITFNSMLTKPFAVFAMEIDSVAQIDVDGMEPRDRTSLLLEINVMSKAMNTLVRNMKEFKSFMPLSMQECVAPVEDDSVTTDSEERANPAGAGASSIRTGAARGAGAYAPSRHSESSGTSDTRSTGHRSSYHEKAKHATQLLAPSLHRRKMSFVVVNAKGFHRSMHQSSERDVIERHQRYIQLCIDNAQTRSGMPESFSGDRVLLTFNGARTCSSHAESAADTAMLMRERWHETLGEGVNMALGSGSVRAGNIGAQSMRRYTMLGNTMSWVHGLERFGRYTEKSIISDSIFAEMVRGRFEYRHYAAVNCEKYTANTTRTCLLITSFASKVTATDDEWMYQLENAAKMSKNSQWNSFFEQITRANWEDASALLLKEGEMHITADDCLDLLKEALEAREFTPTEKLYA